MARGERTVSLELGISRMLLWYLFFLASEKYGWEAAKCTMIASSSLLCFGFVLPVWGVRRELV
jgi:hypothetical protein